MEKLEAVECTVCKESTQALHCPSCGQLIGREPSSFATLFQDLFTNFITLEKSVLLSLLILVRSPGKIVLPYIDGFRNYYPGPGKILLYALTVAALHVAFIDQYILGVQIQEGSDRPQLLFGATFLPVMVLASALTFIRQKRPFVQHAISISYLAGTWFILATILLDLLTPLIGDEPGPLFFVGFLLASFAGNSSIYVRTAKPWKHLANTLLSFLLFSIMTVILIFAIAGISGDI